MRDVRVGKSASSLEDIVATGSFVDGIGGHALFG